MRSVRRTAPWSILIAVFVVALSSPAARATGDGLDAAISSYISASMARMTPIGRAARIRGSFAAPVQDYRIAFRPSFWYPKLEGSVWLEDSNGFSTTLDANRDLDISSPKGMFAGEADLRLGPSDFFLSGFGFSRSGNSTITRTVVFGNIRTTGTANLDTKLDYSSIGLRYGLSLVPAALGGVRFGPTVALNWVHLKLRETADSSAGHSEERIDESEPLPAIGARFELPISRFLVTADAQAMRVTFSQFHGTYYDLSASLTWRPTGYIGIFAGYRTIRANVRGTSGGADYKADLKLRGPFFGVEIRF